jgi:hypothetical protein
MPTRFAVLIAVVALTLSGCRKNEPTKEEDTAPARVAIESQSPAHRHIFPSGVSPLIVKLDPATIVDRDGHLVGGRYTLEYDVLGIEKVKSIRIEIDSPGFGRIQAIDAPVEAHNTLTFDLDPGDSDFGPTVQFRARCPEGTTDWATLGLLATDYPHRTHDALALDSVYPPYIERNPNSFAGSGVKISLGGTHLHRGCTPEAQVDGSPVELHNVVATDRRIETLIQYRDIRNGPVVARYLEVKLQLFGDNLAVEDLARLPFSGE